MNSVAELQLPDAINAVTADSLADYATKLISQDEDVIAEVTASVLLNQDLKIRRYVTLAEGVNVSDLTFKIDGVEVTPIAKGERFYFETKNIPLKLLDKAYSFEIFAQDGSTVYSNEYSVFSYVLRQLEKSTDKDLINLVKSLVTVNQAAKAYFGN